MNIYLIALVILGAIHLYRSKGSITELFALIVILALAALGVI